MESIGGFKVKDSTELFERMPVLKAVTRLVIPTVISQIITVIYNMADTFFIGQLNDPVAVAAATMSMPLFVMMTGIANLFGIGGASFIARSLGEGETARAKKCASFCIWSAAAVALIYGLTIYFSRPVLFPLLGVDSSTYAFCSDYILWTVAVGAVPTVANACLAHLVRSEGMAKEASIGLAFGGVLNIVIDPLFIFALNLGVAGAAMATMLSNTAAVIYFLILIYKRRGTTAINIDLRNYTLAHGIPKEVLFVGFPSFLLLLMGTLSNIVLNKLVADYSNECVAGMGIAKKIDILAFAIANGMTQGVLPLIGYNYGAKNYARMRSAGKTALLLSLAVATVGAVLLFTCAVPLIQAFINDAATVAYGQHFLRVICITCPAIAITMMVISVFQATGQKGRPLVLSFLRKGGIDIPLMLIISATAGVNEIPWATPISDLLAMIISLIMFIPYWNSFKKKIQS